MPNVCFFTNLDRDLAAQLVQPAPDDYQVSIHSMQLPDVEKIALLQGADFLILFPTLLSDGVLRAAAHLELIQLVSAGFDKMNVALARELGIPVANNGGANAIDVAEHTIALILSFYRHMKQMDRNVRTQQWSALDSGATTFTIDGKRVGLIGLGNIGQRTAHLLRAFGAEVLFYDPFPPADDVIAALGARTCSLDELLTQADIVSLHVPLNEATHALLGQRELARMKPTALLVNTCRGPVVDEAALIEALRHRRIGGAALDVLEQEPPAADNPLLALDNVLLTPHIAGVTRDTWVRRGVFIFENLERVRRGEPARALVN